MFFNQLNRDPDLTFNRHPPPPRRLGTEDDQGPVYDEHGQEAVDRGPSLGEKYSDRLKSGP